MAVLIVKNRPPASVDGLTSITLVSATSANGGQTITAPADIQAGDLLVLLNLTGDVGIPVTAVPAGFTSISNVSLTSRREILSYKLATGSEGNSVLSGMTSGAGLDSLYILFVFRGNVAATTATPLDAAGEMTVDTPSNQVVSAASSVTPLVVIGGFSAAGTSIGTVGFSPSQDAFTSVSSTPGAGNIQMGYKIYNSSPADTTMSKDDSGNRNAILSCYIEMAA